MKQNKKKMNEEQREKKEENKEEKERRKKKGSNKVRIVETKRTNNYEKNANRQSNTKQLQ
ncbi:hypothetical protein DPMN_144756 [Dreissena polymorpha]|uniref:Uncharacterized protein n=1 Tax=Dreissena polymorpha TaxID=45954 RepID=A0A9D4F3R4_DREPO|nr:hypothetical protein DPMN_144756 [Dreissena polymorpha]